MQCKSKKCPILVVLTQGQFWAFDIIIACACLYVCVNSEPVRIITHHLFKLGSPNLVQRCKTMILTHWGRVTHICVGKLTVIGSDNGLSPEQRKAIIWTNAGILLIGPLETNFSEILIGIQTFSFKKMHLEMSSAKWHPFVSSSMS